MKRIQVPLIVLMIAALQFSGQCLGSLAWGAPVKGEALRRHKVLNFDGSRVEAVGQRPLDSYSQLEDAEKARKRSHIYERKSGFSRETAETLEQMRYD